MTITPDNANILLQDCLLSAFTDLVAASPQHRISALNFINGGEADILIHAMGGSDMYSAADLIPYYCGMKGVTLQQIRDREWKGIR